MRKAPNARIELELVDHEILITLKSDDGRISTARRIRAMDAFVLSLLLTSEAADVAVTIDVINLVSLQIENLPYDRAWLRIGDGEGGRTVGCLEGKVIHEIGQCLHRLYVAARDSTARRSAAHHFPISYCFIRDDEAT